jgi:hypothetical protein
MDAAKYAKGWYQPKALGLGGLFGFGLKFGGSVSYTRNTSPNFGVDIFKLSGGLWSYIAPSHQDVIFIQLLTGLRFATNSFGKSKRTYFYTSVRAGVGWFDYYKGDDYDYYYGYHGLAFAAELEAGFHLYKYFFLGLTVNQAFFKPDYIHKTHTNNRYTNDTYTETKLDKGSLPKPLIGLRIGVDIGKSKMY